MRRVLLASFTLLLAVVGVAAWFVHDANRFKSPLKAYAEREFGVPITIRGDLEWRLGPGLGLMASGLHTVYAGRAWTIDRLLLRPQLLSILRGPTAPTEWRIAGIDIDNLNVAAGGGNLRAERLVLRDMGLRGAARLTAKLVYSKDAWVPIQIELDGAVAYAGGRLRVSDMVFKVPGADGACNLEVLASQSNTSAGVGLPRFAQPDEGTIAPVDIMRAYDWDGRCDFHRIALATEAVENAQAVLDNKQGGSIVSVRAPSFLGGEAQLQMVIRAGQTSLAWEIEPHLAGVDSLRLGAVLGVDSVIAAPLDLSGRIGMAGNSAKELAASLDADMRFATGAGTINVDWIAAPLAEIGGRLGSPAPILVTAPKLDAATEPPTASASMEATPAPRTTFNYENLSGRWRAAGERNHLTVALDGASFEVEGNYRLLEDRMDLVGVATFGESAKQWGLPLSPGVAALPIHFRCGGTLGKPECRLDATRTIFGGAVDKGRTKADEFINSFVPEDYRERARSLLDSLDSDVDDALVGLKQRLDRH